MRSDRTAGLPGFVAFLLLATGCAGTPARDPPADEPAPAIRDLRGPIVQLALSMVGVQYRYGGTHPREGFDCSGLVYYAFTSNGHGVPRTSREQFDVARKIPLAEAVEGDLVFFRDQEQLSHVGIYLGGGRFVHAPSRGGSVSVASIDAPYYQRNLVAIGRLLP
ncbi:MAG TPA: C40 family peptidase [Steroidobacteraceae bacterium]|nr:C40 family peptidase [Steroidobacteraceae bacterium]